MTVHYDCMHCLLLKGVCRSKCKIPHLLNRERVDEIEPPVGPTDGCTFTISSREAATIRYWQERHKKKCKLHQAETAIGGQFTFQFTTTSIGQIKSVICACGRGLDFTDYDWF